MKWFILICILLTGCHQESSPRKAVQAQPLNKILESTNEHSVAKEDFSDLKKENDESCDSEEELEEKLKKQIEESKKEQKAFQLQGTTDPGCEI